VDAVDTVDVLVLARVYNDQVFFYIESNLIQHVEVVKGERKRRTGKGSFSTACPITKLLSSSRFLCPTTCGSFYRTVCNVAILAFPLLA
jgi:hypothetical protein